MKCLMLYFSGTGNTKVITDLIYSQITQYFTTDILRIEDIVNNKVTCPISEYDLIGIGFPVYGFNCPKIVETFLDMVNPVQKKEVFIFSTCAGPLYLNDISNYGLKRRLIKKGFQIIYEKLFYMLPNVAIQYKKGVARQLYNAAICHAKCMVDHIVNKVVHVRHDGMIAAIIRLILMPIEKVSWPTIPIDFIVNNTCTKCSICINDCPMKNIMIKNNKVKFGLNCIACYRCVYSCPKSAIKGRLYNFAILKEGYSFNKTLDQENEIEGFIDKDTKGYYSIFKDYIGT